MPDPTPTLRDRLTRLTHTAYDGPYLEPADAHEIIDAVLEVLDRVEALEADRHAREAYAAERSEL